MAHRKENGGGVKKPTVYLLHFERPISSKHTAQHYLGYTENLEERILAHSQGQGSRLCAVAKERGILEAVPPLPPTKVGTLRKRKPSIRYQHPIGESGTMNLELCCNKCGREFDVPGLDYSLCKKCGWIERRERWLPLTEEASSEASSKKKSKKKKAKPSAAKPSASIPSLLITEVENG